MLEPLSIAAATAIAKIVLDKFYEGAGSKLGEVVVTRATEAIQKLGNLVWQRCFKGKPDVEHLVEKVGQGSEAETKTLKAYLDKALAPDAELTREVKPFVQEIHQVIVQMESVTAENIQQVFGGQGLQVNNPSAPTIQAKDSPITINYNQT
jgi:hypothetical protein